MQVCDEDGAEASRVDLLEAQIGQIVDVDMIEYHEILKGVFGLGLDGHGQHGSNVFLLFMLQLKIMLAFGHYII